MMGADPAVLAGAAIAVCSAAIPDVIKLKVKRHGGWMESTRAWVGVVGDPSAKKTPVINRATRPLYQNRRGDVACLPRQRRRAATTLSKEEKKTATPPKLTCLKLDDVTIEAAQAVMQGQPQRGAVPQGRAVGMVRQHGQVRRPQGRDGGSRLLASGLRRHSYSWDRTSRGSA